MARQRSRQDSKRTCGAFWDSPTPKAMGCFRTYPTPKPAKLPTFSNINSAPHLHYVGWRLWGIAWRPRNMPVGLQLA